MSEVARWSAADFNRFDVVITVGPSQTLARLMNLPGLRAQLMCLDLGFYHQLLAMDEGAFTRPDTGHHPRARASNRVLGYSCQPRRKIEQDLIRTGFDPRSFRWRWFEYVPMGPSYRCDYRASTQPFDVALLGTSGRDYDLIEPEALRGRRVLFLGTVGRDATLERMRTAADLTVVPRVSEDTYARLLALCRCVVVPMHPASQNVLLSVVDALASGAPLVTNWHRGLERLLRSGAPIVATGRPLLPLFSRARLRSKLSGAMGELLSDERRQRRLAADSIAFARARLDIYAVLERVRADQLK